MILIVKIFRIWQHNVWYTFSPHMHKAHLYNYWKKLIHSRPYGAPFVLEVRESGPWRTSVTGRRGGLLNQTARIPHVDCFRSLSGRAVGAGRGRLAVTGSWVNFWNKRHGFLTPIVSEVCQSGPWTASRDGLLGWTFETNSMDSWRRLFQKSVRAGRGCGPADGRPWRAAGMDFINKRHRFLAPIVAEVRQSGPSEPWRAAEMNFWNKRHGFLAPIV